MTSSSSADNETFYEEKRVPRYFLSSSFFPFFFFFSPRCDRKPLYTPVLYTVAYIQDIYIYIYIYIYISSAIEETSVSDCSLITPVGQQPKNAGFGGVSENVDSFLGNSVYDDFYDATIRRYFSFSVRNVVSISLGANGDSRFPVKPESHRNGGHRMPFPLGSW